MLGEKIREELKKAMLSRDSGRVLVLRGLMTALEYKKSQLMTELRDEDEVMVLRSELKKRNEAMEIYKAHNEEERAKVEAQEAVIIKEFLPAEILEEDVKRFLVQEWDKDKSINKGVLVGKAMAHFGKGRIDGTVVGRLVSELK